MRSIRAAVAVGVTLVLVGGLALLAPSGAAVGQPEQAQSSAGLILQVDEGERRVRRSRAEGAAGLTTPFILKVDRRNGASEKLVMGYEEIAPGDSIRSHRHQNPAQRGRRHRRGWSARCPADQERQIPRLRGRRSRRPERQRPIPSALTGVRRLPPARLVAIPTARARHDVPAGT